MSKSLNLIDVHTHAFPDPDTGVAWMDDLSVRSRRTGFIDELAELITGTEISRAVLLLHHPVRWWPNAIGDLGERDRKQVATRIRAYNHWGCQVGSRDERFIPFIGVNARFMSATEIREEIRLGAAAGAKGVKITLNSMGVYANDELIQPIIDGCLETQLPLLSQSGSGSTARVPGHEPLGRPSYWSAVLSRFPELRLILAHMGQGYETDLIELASKYPNVYTDTSMRLSGLGKPDRFTVDQLVRTIREIGVDRVMFGSNYPFVNPAVYASVFLDLPLSADEKELIANDNFNRVIGLV